eukprot:c2265_g1_i1.p1 GENE.c2265_g1_i1~~c2265_g1_i1.p1  ORF type:complete len:471 (+),score=32.17 c2265_g1_i1:88-1413(+)
MSVVCIEKRGSLGGTCLNVGCIPSKALLNSSHMYSDALKKFPNHGIICNDVKVDLPQLMKQKTDAVNGLTKGIEGLLKKNKVDYSKGFGKLTSANTVSVSLNDGTTATYKAKNIILATGSEVMPLPGITIDEKTIVSSTGVLSLSSIPKTMVVIGGGVIGLELGSVWSRLGTKVTVVEFLSSIGGGMDNEVASEFQKILKKQGLEFKLGMKVTAATPSSNGVSLTLAPAAGGANETMEADVVLVSIGRRPYTEGLGLEAAGVKLDERKRVAVNEHWETNVKGIYAIGDITKGPMLAHKAEEEGIAVVEQIANGHGHVNYDVIPSVVYTYPEVAWVGKSEEQLKSENIKFKKGKFPFLANSRAKTNDDVAGFVKVLADATTDKILGVHIINGQAGELIGEMGLAMEYGASSEDVARTCHAHPTLSEAVKEACMATYDKPIHM